MKHFYLLILLLITTISFAVDKTYKASSGDLILDASGDIVVNKNLGIGTNNPDDKIDLRDGMLVLSDTDVSHPMGTGFGINATTYFMARPFSTTNGGSWLAGVSDSDISGMYITGTIGSNDPTDTTPGVVLGASKYNGTTGDTALGTSETVLQIKNWVTTLMTILGNGYVGIGVNPSYPLHLDKDVSNYVAQFVNGDASGHGLKIVTNNSGTSNIALRIDSTAGEIFNVKNSGTTELSVRTDGNCGIGNVCSGVSSGSTVQNTQNLTGTPTIGKFTYLVVGRLVNASLRLSNVDPTGTGAPQFTVTVPFTNAFTSSTEANGVCQSDNGVNVTYGIFADNTASKIYITANNPGDVSVHSVYCVFTYERQ